MHVHKRIIIWLFLLFVAALSGAVISRAALPEQVARAQPPTTSRVPRETMNALQSPQARARIEPALLRALLIPPTAELLRYVVYMRAQAQLDVLPEADLLAQRKAVTVALQSTARDSQKDLLALLAQEQRAGQVHAYQPLWICNAVTVQGSAESVARVAALPEVRIIRLDREHRIEDSALRNGESQGIPWNIARVGADFVWGRLGIDGRGIVVATMDSGVDGEHPALKTHYRGYTARGLPLHRGNWLCVTPEGYTKPADGLGAWHARAGHDPWARRHRHGPRRHLDRCQGL